MNHSSPADQGHGREEVRAIHNHFSGDGNRVIHPSDRLIPSQSVQITAAQVARSSNRSEKLTVVEKPKRARTAYNLFFRDHQVKLNVLRLRTKLESGNMAAQISRAWKDFPASNKAVYFQMAARDKCRYYKEKKAYDEYLYRVNQERNHVNPAGSQGLTALLAQGQQASIEISPESFASNPVTNAMAMSSTSEQASSTSNPSDTYECEDEEPAFSPASIAALANQLDEAEIDFIIRSLS